MCKEAHSTLLMPDQAEEEAKRTPFQAAQASQGRLQTASSMTSFKEPSPASSHQQADSRRHQQADDRSRWQADSRGDQHTNSRGQQASISSDHHSNGDDSAASVLAVRRETKQQTGFAATAQTPEECSHAELGGET